MATAPKRLFVQISTGGGTISYERDPREVYDNGKPVHNYRLVEQCEWRLDSATDSCLWETACGEAFQFTDGSPEGNSFKYCYKCGGEILAVRVEGED